MRKLWFRRKAVSTMIGGIIVLTIFLTALVSMVFVSQQNDAYQGTVKQMSQKDIERASENLQILYPGISYPPAAQGVSCAGAASCDRFTMAINNLAGIGTEIARIYINSTTECSGICILDPAIAATNSSFNFGDRYVNPSEPNHVVNFWIATNKLTNQTAHQVSLVTTRGRVFSFLWPFPPSGASVPTGSLYLGCLAIDFDNRLITYTEYSPATHHTPAVPLAGGWLFPGGSGAFLIFYIRVSNICTANVTLLDKSTFYAIEYTGAGGGAAPAFYIAAPMAQSYCSYFSSPTCIFANPGNTYPTSQGNLQAYNASLSGCSLSNTCYNIPPAPAKGQQSPPVYVLFGANKPCFVQSCSGGLTAGNAFQGSIGGTYVVFLAIYWMCTTSGESTCAQNYEFGVTLPFITIQTCDPTPGKPLACP